MIDTLFYYLDQLNTLLWGYAGVGLILLVGTYLTIYSKAMQLRLFPKIVRNFVSETRKKNRTSDNPLERGTSPLKVFFASLGGCIGIGNLVTVAIAIKVGGPGALVWIWIVAFLGMILKYSEVYLGITFRIPNHKNSYDGGPMYFLKKAFPKFPLLPSIMAVFLAIYGVEIFMFSVVKESIHQNWHINENVVIFSLLALVLFGVMGGVRRIGQISSILVPCFVLVFVGMTSWVLINHSAELPLAFYEIFRAGFTGHAVAGGTLGGSLILVMAKGVSAAAYSGDVGIGYASIINSETRVNDPARQASLSIFGIFLDSFIVCTCTVLLVYVTGVWEMDIKGELLVQEALSHYFPYMDIFMPLFLFSLGYSTILPYMLSGIKAATFIAPKYGTKIYYAFGTSAFLLFSYVDSTYALTLMQIAGGCLMLINLPALYQLRKHVRYTF